jgi:hypothetical protein
MKTTVHILFKSQCFLDIFFIGCPIVTAISPNPKETDLRDGSALERQPTSCGKRYTKMLTDLKTHKMNTLKF